MKRKNSERTWNDIHQLVTISLLNGSFIFWLNLHLLHSTWILPFMWFQIKNEYDGRGKKTKFRRKIIYYMYDIFKCNWTACWVKRRAQAKWEQKCHVGKRTRRDTTKTRNGKSIQQFTIVLCACSHIINCLFCGETTANNLANDWRIVMAIAKNSVLWSWDYRNKHSFVKQTRIQK